MIPQFSTMSGKQVDGHLVYPISLGQSSPKDIYTIKANGIEEDIVYSKSPTNGRISLSYKLKLPSSLQARMMSGGNLGIYSASPALFGNISYGSPADQLRVAKARQDSAKNHLVFAIPRPTIITTDAQLGQGSNLNNQISLSFSKGIITITAKGLNNLHGPFSIDP
jgi:hypothetical protein